MDERRWERIGAASGIVAALFLIVPGFTAPPPPHVDASVTKWVSYVADHRRALLASTREIRKLAEAGLGALEAGAAATGEELGWLGDAEEAPAP